MGKPAKPRRPKLLEKQHAFATACFEVPGTQDAERDAKFTEFWDKVYDLAESMGFPSFSWEWEEPCECEVCVNVDAVNEALIGEYSVAVIASVSEAMVEHLDSAIRHLAKGGDAWASSCISSLTNTNDWVHNLKEATNGNT